METITNRAKKITDIIKQFNIIFVQKMIRMILIISSGCYAFFSAVGLFLYITIPEVDITNFLTSGIASVILFALHKISKDEKKIELSAYGLIVIDYIFFIFIYLFHPISFAAIFVSSVAVLSMMFIAFTFFAPNTKLAIIHSFLHATTASVLYIWYFGKVHYSVYGVLFQTPYFTLITFPLVFFCAALIVSYYVHYRTKEYTSFRNVIQTNMITGLHKKLIADDSYIGYGYSVASVLINIEEDAYGGDFIALKEKEDSVEFFIGDVADHGIDSSQIAFSLMSIFKSKTERHPEETLLNCNDFLREIGWDYGGLSYCCIVSLHRDGTIDIYGSTGINPTFIDGPNYIGLETKNIILGTMKLKNIEKFTVTMNKNTMLIVKTDGWNSDYDEKASIIITYVG